MKTKLSNYITYNLLVNGCVVIKLENGSQKHVRPSSNTVIKDNFNPDDYALLHDTKYPELIVYSDEKDRFDRKLFNEIKLKMPKPNDKIHIYSREGVYTVVDINDKGIRITCKTWSYSKEPIKTVPLEDFKCYYKEKSYSRNNKPRTKRN
jgi:hypothetical protein